MASGACSSFQVCDSVSDTGSFQNQSDAYTHVSEGTRNRKRKSWEVEDFPVVVQESSRKGKAKEGLEKIVWRCSSRPEKVCEKVNVHASLCYLFRIQPCIILIQLMKCHIANAASLVLNTNLSTFFTLREIQFKSITSNSRQYQNNTSSL